MDDIFGLFLTAVICGSIAFLVTYAMLVEVTALMRERTLLAGTIVAVIVILIAAALTKPLMSRWPSASGLAAEGHVDEPRADPKEPQ